MKKQSGFTVIELIVVAAFLITAGIVLLLQVQKIKHEHINNQKKTAINAMHYSLEEGFYKQHGHYPEQLADDTLKTMDAALLKDPQGVAIGDAQSSYRYEAKDCWEGKCKQYTLRALLDGEEDFVKQSRN